MTLEVLLACLAIANTMMLIVVTATVGTSDRVLREVEHRLDSIEVILRVKRIESCPMKRGEGRKLIDWLEGDAE